MKLFFLGTGAGIPSRLRNVSSLALVFPRQKGETWLFDCGEATQHQILHSPLRLSRINRIFITHLHGDHLFGLPGILGSRSFQGATTPLTIYGPKGIKPFVEVSLETSQTHLRYPLQIVEFDAETRWEQDDSIVYGQRLHHRIHSYGFRIEEKDQPGELQTQLLAKQGIEPGPIYGELKKGKTVKLANGLQLHGSDYLGPAKPGKKIAILGDTRVHSDHIQLVQGVDVLVHEATYRAGWESSAETYYHSTSQQAARFGKEAQVKALILHHISSRYQEEESHQLLEEAQQIFPNTYLAYDGWEYEVQ